MKKYKILDNTKDGNKILVITSGLSLKVILVYLFISIFAGLSMFSAMNVMAIIKKYYKFLFRNSPIVVVRCRPGRITQDQI